MEIDNSHSSKKFRNESGAGVRLGNNERESNSHKLPASAVVHVRGLADRVSDSDLRDAVISFGAVSYIMQIPNKNMALIEFENLESASELVNYAQSNSVFVANKPAQFNYSTSSKIKRPESTYIPVPNCVLLLTILNSRHPITVEVINAICCPFGTVVRIVIFRKNGVQAMVEFDSIESATKAKHGLHGQDIYSGCCHIKADFAKPTTLNVKKNDADTWDFTVGSYAKEAATGPQQKNQPLLADPRCGSGPIPFGSFLGSSSLTSHNAPASMSSYSSSSTFGNDTSRRPVQYQPLSSSNPGLMSSNFSHSSQDTFDMSQGSYPSTVALLNAYEPQSIASTSGSIADCVLMVYGMDASRFNCQRLFNLLCIYGTVIRIKFLKTKEGVAMVQMGDRESCDRVLHSINGCSCFGNKLSVSMSKQTYLQDVANPHQLSDGTAGYMDFVGSRNQRYNTPDAAAKNRPVPPTSTLYFYNAPPSLTEDQLTKVFDDADATEPMKICIFPPKSEKSSRGLIQWNNVEFCTDALILANHAQLPSPLGSRTPFVLKLAFSQAVIE